MIAFASLFLGLILGVQPVRLLTDERVAAVELALDGRTVARLEEAPWVAEVDLGGKLVPHELVAVAFDAEGRELDRARQWINLPRPPAEAELLLEGGADGRGLEARLAWESTVSERPISSRIVFDGRELEVDDPSHFALPDHDPDKLHYLRVELEFSPNVRSVVETTFGGTFTDRVDSHQTALPVVLAGEGELGPAERLAGWITASGEPVRVVAVDKGPAEVIVVRDKTTQEHFDRTLLGARGSPRSLRFTARMKKGQSVRLLSPFARIIPRGDHNLELFPPSGEIGFREGGLLWMLVTMRPSGTALARQRLADAVAVAGMMAASRDRRRAVVLITGDGSADASRHSPQVVRGYLESLRVPLVVWSPVGGGARTAGAWGECEDISNLAGLDRAVRRLARRLERQRIVWLEGFHLPNRLSLAPGVAGVSLPL